jgi:transposase
MDERMRFVIRLKDGESMAGLCREFGISRKTGYKIYQRYEQCGLDGLTDRARRPFRYVNQLPEQVEAAIVAAKKDKPRWGARKIRDRLLRKLPHAIKVPAASTVHAVLDRHGLVAHEPRRRAPARGTALSEARACCDRAGRQPTFGIATLRARCVFRQKLINQELTAAEIGSLQAIERVRESHKIAPRSEAKNTQRAGDFQALLARRMRLLRHP